MPHDEFVLEQFADGGLLMNLETGNLSHLNPSAVEIWSMAIASVPESEIARRLASIHGIAAGRAVRDVDQALRALTPASEPIRPPTDLTYEASGSGYVLSFQGSRAVAYDTEASELRLLDREASSECGIYLRAIAPKIVAESGACVLHAAAVTSPQFGVLAFVGASGAGKTTTAHSFVSHGFGLLCEDKLVWRAGPSAAEVAVNGESTINRWIRETVALWARDGATPCETRSLFEAAKGPSLPIRRIFVLGGSRVDGTSMQLRRLPPSIAAREILGHGFYGSIEPEAWKAQLEAVSELSRSTEVYEACMPTGLEALATAVRSYIERMAS